MTSIEIFSLDILIILIVAIPLALTPSLFVVTASRQIRHLLTGLWCAIGFFLAMLTTDFTLLVSVPLRFFMFVALFWGVRWLWRRVKVYWHRAEIPHGMLRSATPPKVYLRDETTNHPQSDPVCGVDSETSTAASVTNHACRRAF